jgi:hypothetical protein
LDPIHQAVSLISCATSALSADTVRFLLEGQFVPKRELTSSLYKDVFKECVAYGTGHEERAKQLIESRFQIVQMLDSCGVDPHGNLQKPPWSSLDISKEDELLGISLDKLGAIHQYSCPDSTLIASDPRVFEWLYRHGFSFVSLLEDFRWNRILGEEAPNNEHDQKQRAATLPLVSRWLSLQKAGVQVG